MKRKPNVLLLFTDMQRADTIHALGNQVVRTPALDRLVAEGTAFVDCQTPSPVCVPARCSMHYGRYPQRTGCFDNTPMPPDDGLSIPGVLASQSYATAAVGKCHFLPDKSALRGFGLRLKQEECCSDPGKDDYCRWLADAGLDYDEPHGTRGEMYYVPQISLHDVKSHPSQWVGDRSVEFVRANSKGGTPWMLFSSFIHPHPPFAPPKPWHKLYRAPLMPAPYVPSGCESVLTWVNRSQNRFKYRDAGLDLNLLRCIKAYYYACVSFVDFQIGRILNELEACGVLDDTIVAFASDHGEYLGDFNCFGKRGMHDASTRVPLILRHPGLFKAGARCDVPASLVDLLPTFAAAAGVEPAKLRTDGVDLAALASGDAKRETVFSQYQKGASAIYMAANAEWKYVYSSGDGKEFLFDRKADPRDSRSKAGTPALKPVRDRMKRILLEYLKSAGAEEAFTESDGVLDWKPYPRLDESWRSDPDARLGFQDHDARVLEEPGYSRLA